jgi:hypothetical protein
MMSMDKLKKCTSQIFVTIDLRIFVVVVDNDNNAKYCIFAINYDNNTKQNVVTGVDDDVD